MANRPKRNMSEDLDRLIKAIGDCKCKSEEDRVMLRAIESTKSTIKNGVVDKTRTKDFLVKLIYFEMLGHDSTFGHFLAVQACGSNSVMTKLVGYLAVAQFLDSSDSLILLLVNTWRSDLQNENHVVVCAALTAICKLVNGDAIAALASQVVTLLSHPREIVRKKALLTLHRFCQIDPQGDAGLAGINVKNLLSHALCDPDPAVMSATLCGLYELIKVDPVPFRSLIPSLTSIIKQVTGHRLSKSYEYHHSPAPFIQIRLLRLLALLGAGDKHSTDNMKNVLLTVLRNANPRNTIGYAVLFECIRTLTTVSPDTQLLEEAARSVFKFLQSNNSHNLKYMGLDALGGIVSINFRQAHDHQTAVMDCLEDPDDTLKLKTLELLYKMTKSSNVEIVVEKLIQYLKTCTDEHIQTDICSKVTDLAERYAPDRLWYVETMIEMFEAAGEGAPIGAEQTLLQLISEQDTELHKSVLQLSLKILGKQKLPKNLLQVVCWVLGEYGSLIDRIPETNMNSMEIQESLCELMLTSNQDSIIQGYILAALGKLSARMQGKLSRDAEDLVRKSMSSKSTDLQQRALEIQSFVENNPGQLIGKVMPYGGASEDLEAFYSQIESLSFLNSFVQDALAKGAVDYVPEMDRDDFGVALISDTETTVSGVLKFNPYQNPTVSQRVPIPEVELPTTPVDVQTPAMNPVSVAPGATPAVQEPTLRLTGIRSRRWGPVNSQDMQQEPPVIHVSTGKLQYSQPTQEKTTVVLEVKSSEETSASRPLSDRNSLIGSLFGETTVDVKGSNGRVRDRTIAPKTSNKKDNTSVSTPSQGPGILPELDLLDLSDPQDSTSTSVKPTEPPIDPFAGMDFSNGVNGSTSALSAPIDLDALYETNTPQNTISTAFAPQTMPMMMTSHNPASIVGMMPNMGAPPVNKQALPKFANPAKKDDPFKDLLS
eukprot:g6770.t1